MANLIRVLLADDHTLVREGLKRLFALTPDIVVTTEASNGNQVLDALAHDYFDLLLLDMSMPGCSGPELIARIIALGEHPPVLVLTMHNEPQIARRALAAGAAGYLTKDNDPAILLAAVRRIAAGGRFVDPALAESMAFESVSPPPDTQRPAHEILSKREYQIFLLLAQGVGVKEIAADLSISNKTVSTHKVRLMEKLKFSNNADLVRYAILQELIQ